MIHHQLQEMEWFFPWLKTIDPQDPAAGQDLFTIENLSQIDAYLARTEHISDESSGLPDGEDIRSLLALSKQRCTTLLEKGETLLNRIEELITAHDFKVLYDRSHRLFSIGYNVADGRLDPTFYNLLASEARQASLPRSLWASPSETLVCFEPYLYVNPQATGFTLLDRYDL